MTRYARYTNAEALWLNHYGDYGANDEGYGADGENAVDNALCAAIEAAREARK